MKNKFNQISKILDKIESPLTWKITNNKKKFILNDRRCIYHIILHNH